MDPEMLVPSEANPWRRIRAVRFSQSEAEANSYRRQVFVAALEQAEQMWFAARSVGVVSAPIVLYDALTQAGRAVVAQARGGVFERQGAGHGLRLDFNGRSPLEKPSMTDTFLSEHGNGQVQAIAKVLDSPLLSSRASIAEVVSSLNASDHLRFSGDHPVPLYAYFASPTHTPTAPRMSVWNVSLSDLARHGGSIEASDDGVETPVVGDLSGFLEIYPDLANLGPPSTQTVRAPLNAAAGYLSLNLQWADVWSADMSAQEQMSWWAQAFPTLQARGTMNEFRIHLVPIVGSNQSALHRLVTWWLVLFGFSILARYHPSHWMRLTDVDTSPEAVVIEALLEQASEEIPTLLAHELVRMRAIAYRGGAGGS